MKEKRNPLIPAFILWVPSFFVIYIIISLLLGYSTDEELKRAMIIAAIIAFIFTAIITIWTLNYIKEEEEQKNLKEQKEKERNEKRNQIAKEARKRKKKEKEEQTKKEIDALTKNFGSKYAEDIFKMVYKKDMTKEMINEIDRRKNTSPIYKTKANKDEEWFYNSALLPYLGFEYKISFDNDNVSEIEELEDGIWIDMTKEILVKACGEPADIKKNVGRDLIKEKWYYGGRETRQGTIVFKREVRLVNGIVDGWSELE